MFVELKNLDKIANLSFNSDGCFRGGLKKCAVNIFRIYRQVAIFGPPLVNSSMAWRFAPRHRAADCSPLHRKGEENVWIV